MKVLFLSLILSLNIFAGDGVGDNSGGGKFTWKQIFKDYTLLTNEPRVKFGNRIFSSFETCYVEATDEIRTKKMVDIYDLNERNSFFSKPIEKKYLYTDRVYEVQFCGGTNSCVWTRQMEEFPLEFKVEVSKEVMGNNRQPKFLFKKDYVMPRCQ